MDGDSACNCSSLGSSPVCRTCLEIQLRAVRERYRLVVVLEPQRHHTTIYQHLHEARGHHLEDTVRFIHLTGGGEESARGMGTLDAADDEISQIRLYDRSDSCCEDHED